VSPEVKVIPAQVSAPAPTPPLVLLRAPVPPAPADADAAPAAAESLPFTGGDAQSLALTALALVGLGGVLARRRRTNA
jgi:LPXTG-motif cell wall-anchored protein